MRRPARRTSGPSRRHARRGALLPLLSVVPLLGPAIYLLLRPKTDTSAP
jgi:hypothetical protein